MSGKCADASCICHTDPKHRVLTPFPEGFGPVYCCSRCALTQPCQCHEQGLWFCWCPVHHGAPSYKCPVCVQMIEDGRTYLYGPKSEGREHLFPSKESQ